MIFYIKQIWLWPSHFGCMQLLCPDDESGTYSTASCITHGNHLECPLVCMSGGEVHQLWFFLKCWIFYEAYTELWINSQLQLEAFPCRLLWCVWAKYQKVVLTVSVLSMQCIYSAFGSVYLLSLCLSFAAVFHPSTPEQFTGDITIF